jgi:hypothetical protein
MSLQGKWQMEKKKDGLCIKCGKPAAIHSRGMREGQNSVYCPKHLMEQRK